MGKTLTYRGGETTPLFIMTEQKIDLEVATKQAMGFSIKAPTCEQCIYITEEADKYVDRSWHTICTFSNLCNFTVEHGSHCNKFKKR